MRFRTGLLGLAAVVLCLSLNHADARLLRQEEAAPEPVAEAVPVAEGDVLCCDRCIIYKTHHAWKKFCDCCESPVKTTLLVKDPTPCACCSVAVDVCLPGCCVCPPTVSCKKGLFGCYKVTYCWKCGYKVVVDFKKSGKVIVHSYGSA